MAGIALPGETSVAGASPLNRLARSQYAALATMRWRMLTNSVRSVQGAFELGARSIALIFYSLMGLGLGFGLGIGAASLVSTGKWQFLPVQFWIVFLVWQALPIAIASFQEQFDLSGLLRFPVSFASFCVLQLVWGLVDVPMILGGLCCLGMGVGIVVARPDLWAWTLALLGAFALFNVVLVRTVLAWVDRWLAQRKTREIVSGFFLLLMLSLQLLNPALREHPHRGRRHHGTAQQQDQANARSDANPWTRRAEEVSLWLPPGLAAAGIADAAENRVQAAAGAFGLLGLYAVATGGILAWRLRAEYRGESLGEAPALKKAETGDRKWLIDGSGPIAAVMEKELRSMPRSMPILFAIGGPLLTVLIIGTVLRNSMSGHPFTLAFPLCVSYALLGFTQMIYNNLGAEGTGIQLLFFSPTPMRKVLLAKNLFHGLLYTSVAVVAGIFAALRLGVPDGAVMAATGAWLLFAVPANLTAGNIVSLMIPFRVNPGRLSRQQGSHASALISMLIQAAVMGIGLAVFEVCLLLERIWLATPVLLALAAIMLLVWMRVLKNVDSMANRHKDALIMTLAKTE
jgi:ABC-2 type transport system permease protein